LYTDSAEMSLALVVVPAPLCTHFQCNVFDVGLPLPFRHASARPTADTFPIIFVDVLSEDLLEPAIPWLALKSFKNIQRSFVNHDPGHAGDDNEDFSPDSMRKFLASGTAIEKPATDPPAWAE